MKRIVMVGFLLCLTLMLLASFSFAEPKNPDTIVYVNYLGPETMDPHWCAETGSGEVIYQTYDSLINFKGESTSEHVPMLATEVPSVENGLIKDNSLTYIFPIRKGVKFHNGDILTPEDVVYSFKRALILDRSGAPTWMLSEPLLAVHSIKDKATEVTGVEKYSDLFVDGDLRGELKAEYKETMIKVFTDYIDKTVEVDGDKVVFHLAQAYAPFLNILNHTLPQSSIINKKWAIAQGAWDGKADNWWKYHDPEIKKNPLTTIVNGTGPFVLKRWVPGEILMLERFDDYWRGPAKVKNVHIRYITEYSTRKLMLQNGDADMVHIPEQYLSEVENMEGVTVIKNLPSLVCRTGLFPWTINAAGNNYIGSGKLDGEGIPPDFFSDIHVRKGFSYLFPYDIFTTNVMEGMAMRTPGPIIKGIPGHTDDPALFYEFSLEKAEEEFKLAWDGQLWEKGFKFNMIHTEGNAVAKSACDMLSNYAKMLNPKFNVEVLGVQWTSLLKSFLTERIPIWSTGRQVEFLDPHNFASAFMGSQGDYGEFLGEAYKEFAIKNVDPLLEKGLKETEDPLKRLEIYKELAQIAHDQAISLYFCQPLSYHVQRDWIKGWYYNPSIQAMPFAADFYNLTKGE